MIKALTGLRALAALWVVFYHYSYVDGYIDAAWPGLVRRAYLGVDIFFVLSGYVLAHRYAHAFREQGLRAAYGPYLRSRFARVYPAHLAALLLLFAAMITGSVMAYPPGHDVLYPIFGFGVAVLMLHSTGIMPMEQPWNLPSWSVSAEMLAYALLFPLLVRLRRPWTVMALGLIAWGALSLYALHAHHGSFRQITYGSGWLRILPAFTAGYALRLYGGALPSKLSALLFVLCSAILSLGSAWDTLMIPAAAALVALLARHSWRAFTARPVVRLGEMSYSLYITHHLWYGLLCAYFPKDWPPFLAVGTMTLLSLFPAWLCWRGVERPARQWLLRRSYQKSTPP